MLQKMLKNYLIFLHNQASSLNLQHIDDLLEKNPKAKLLDLGCDNGSVTLRFAKKVKTKQLYGVEIVEERIKIAKKNGLKIQKYDLEKKLGYKDNEFDVVVSNQVIEHLRDTDTFMSEIYRILKPGGYVIISTENASAWENIFASVMGWQIFSLTNFSIMRCGLGNPFAINKDIVPPHVSWNHVRIFNFFGLKELFEIHGYKVDAIRGAGYFPIPFAQLGNLDKIHGHYMIFKGRKPISSRK
jgi:SAM-dependent methyltransferase